MSTNPSLKSHRHSAVFRNATVLLGALLSFHTHLHAAISEPDNLVYGSIYLDGAPVTAARSDVTVEARRASGGPAVASYRMGSNPALGNFYSLSITLESGPAPVSQEASTIGDTLDIVVSDSSGTREQATYSVDSRGSVTRLDFGTVANDVDGNGLPDLWELAHFGATGQNPAAINRNGQTTMENFLAGTDPNDQTDRFQVHVSLENNQRIVSFFARAAEGPGYSGLKRYYTLETSPDLKWQTWSGVTGFIGVEGSNQTVVRVSPETGSPAFFRGVVRLVAK